MSDGIYSALSGAVSQDNALAVLSENLANQQTTGFKAVMGAYTQIPGDDGTGGHVQFTATKTDFRPGLLTPSNDPMDLALPGSGFFVLQTEDGIRLARGIRLNVRSDGLLQTIYGLPVLTTSGPVTVPYGSNLRIDQQGTIYADDNMLGQLQVVDVQNPQNLKKEAFGLWDPHDEPLQIATTNVQSGAIERSNVDPVRLMTDLIVVQRAYEIYSRSIETIRSNQQKLTDKLG